MISSMAFPCFALVLIFHGSSCSTSSVLETLRDSILDFSTSGLNNLVQISPQENILYSPFSVYSALMMTHLGAGGKTAHQICQTLKLCHVNATIAHKTFGSLLKDLLSDMELTQALEIANGLFVDQGFDISQSYESSMRSFYSSAVKQVDFRNDSLNTVAKINAWVRQKTKGKIHTLLQKSPSVSTKVLLINAVHFKGQWKWQFDPQATEPFGHFYVSPQSWIKVPIMSGKMLLALGHNPTVKASILELPFVQSRLSMFIILPDDPGYNLHLNATSIKLLIGSMKKQDVNVRLPKFTLDKNPSVTRLLWTLGIQDMFSPAEADLSGIADDIFVTDMIHRALIHVDEKGSIASAATLTLVERVGYVDEQYFEANRPFTFLIMDKQTGAVLFMGRIASL